MPGPFAESPTHRLGHQVQGKAGHLFPGEWFSPIDDHGVWEDQGCQAPNRVLGEPVSGPELLVCCIKGVEPPLEPI